jgi:ATP-binding cassette subfamily D (ALD) long-chain fatty acid import protein
MAAQSKLRLLPPDRTIKSIISQLTELYLKHRTNISRTVYLTLFFALLNRIRSAISEQKAAAIRQAAARRRGSTTLGHGGVPKRPKVELNREFFKNLFRLLRICVPGWRSKEMGLLISHSIFLVVRTLISLKVAAMDGQLVSSLVRGRGKDFLIGIVWWMLIAIPATFTNSMVCTAVDLRSALLIEYAAVLPSMQALPAIPNAINESHSRKIPFEYDFLLPLCVGRSNKECRPADYCGCF